jgi:hypothetical protein
MAYEIFAIVTETDGTESIGDRIDLIALGGRSRGGIGLSAEAGGWAQEPPGFKYTVRSSPLAEGSRPVFMRHDDITATIELVISAGSADNLIRYQQDLYRMLEKAVAYWVSGWQDEPVWLEAQGSCESEKRYAIIKTYTPGALGNPFAPQFKAGQHSVNVTLTVTHTPWMANKPGTGTCVQVSATQDWQYGTWASVQATAQVNSFFETSGGGCGAATLLAFTTAPDVWRSVNGTVWNNAAVAPANAIIQADLYTDGFIYGVTAAGGLERSNNCGANWAAVGGSPNGTAILAASDGYLYVFDPTLNLITRSNNPAVLWTVVLEGMADATANNRLNLIEYNGVIYCMCDYTIYRSSNGTYWDTLPRPIRTINQYIRGITLSDRALFAFSNTTADGFYYSGDGDNWDTSYSYLVSQGVGGSGSTIVEGIIYANSAIYVATRAGVFESTDLVDWHYTGEPSDTRAVGAFSVTPTYLYRWETGGNIERIDLTTQEMGRDVTCEDEVYIINHENLANITHIVKADTGGTVFSTNLYPIAAYPFDLTTNPIAVNDATYFGISTTTLDNGPFWSLVFDVDTVFSTTTTLTGVWEYWDGGAWQTLAVTDNTTTITGVPWRIAGVNSVHWIPPSNWTPVAVGGFTCWWVRYRVTGVAGTITIPTQRNRQVYTITRGGFSIDDAQVGGDIPAFVQVKLHDRAGTNTNNLAHNRAILTLRSDDRGVDFSPFIIYYNQKPPGIKIYRASASTAATDPEEIGGVPQAFTISSTYTTFTDFLSILFMPDIAKQYIGAYHAYMRVGVDDEDLLAGDIDVRLRVYNAVGSVTYTTEYDTIKTNSFYELLDLGRLSIDDTEDGQFLIFFSWRNNSGADKDIRIHDLILMPTDEYLGDLVDISNVDEYSYMGRNFYEQNGTILDIDSVTMPKNIIKSRIKSSEHTQRNFAHYMAKSAGPVILQANADQRAWVLSARSLFYKDYDGDPFGIEGFDYYNAFFYDAWDADLNGYLNWSLRAKIPSSALSGRAGKAIQVALRSSAAGGGLNIAQAYVGHYGTGGNAWRFDGNQQQLFWRGLGTVTIPANTIRTSDPLQFAYTPGTDLIVAIDIANDGANDDMRHDTVATGYNWYGLNTGAGVFQSAFQDPGGYAANASEHIYVEGVDVLGDIWIAEPWAARSVQVFKNERYLGMRGNR